MKIEHAAMWVEDLEAMTGFYQRFLGGVAGPVYHNPARLFHSVFLTFEGGVRLELMHRPGLVRLVGETMGLAHLSFSVGNVEAVDRLTATLKAAGCQHLDGPRWTGDGYYEGAVVDPEGNRIEITV